MNDGWTDEAPDPGEFATIRLVRVPTAGGIQGICTSNEVLGKWTHWDNFRTQPCPGDNCPLCLAGKPKRWQGYISMMNQMTHRQHVVQVTPLAKKALDEAKQQYGHLRGLLILFGRIAKRNNARITVETRQLTQPVPNLLQPVDIPRYMALIWQSNGDLA